MITELTAGNVRPCFFFECELSSGYLRYWTGSTDITWNSQTWTGNGFLKNMGQISESKDALDGILVELTGEPSALISTVFNNLRRGKSGSLYFGFLNSSDAVISTPIEFTGRLDSAELLDGETEASIRLNYESDLVRLDEANEMRFNAETQKIFYPSDDGFEYMEALQNFQGYWGKPNSSKKAGKEQPKKGSRGQKKRRRQRRRRRNR